jgi:HNH endonuclease
VDHIKPLIEGGALLDLANTRSMCASCHADVTMELRARRTGRPVRRYHRAEIDPATGLPKAGERHWWSDES